MKIEPLNTELKHVLWAYYKYWEEEALPLETVGKARLPATPRCFKRR